MSVVVRISEFHEWEQEKLRQGINQAKKANQKILPILVETFGGDVYSMSGMLSLIDDAKKDGIEFVTITSGYAMSAGAVLFAAGSRRYIGKYATVMIHEPRGWSIGTHTDQKISVQQAERIKSKMFALLDNQSNKESGYYQNLINQINNADLYLDAQQSVDHGLATAIGVPDLDELIAGKEPKIDSDCREAIKIYMQHDFKPESPAAKNSQRRKVVDLTQLKASLQPDELKIVESLESRLNASSVQVAEFQTKLSAVEAEKVELAKKIEANQKQFVTSSLDEMVLSGKITKARREQEEKLIARMPADLQNDYIANLKLNATSSALPQEIPGGNEGSIDLSGNWKDDPALIAEKFQLWKVQNKKKPQSVAEHDACWSDFCNESKLFGGSN